MSEDFQEVFDLYSFLNAEGRYLKKLSNKRFKKKVKELAKRVRKDKSKKKASKVLDLQEDPVLAKAMEELVDYIKSVPGHVPFDSKKKMREIMCQTLRVAKAHMLETFETVYGRVWEKFKCASA